MQIRRQPCIAPTLVLALGLATGPVAVRAQDAARDVVTPAPTSSARRAGDVAFIGINAVLGGVTAGVVRELHGGSFTDGFLPGLLGGAAAYGGRRLAAQRFDGAGLFGREAAALGVSVIHNAGAGVPALQRLFLPLGPVDFYLRTGAAAEASAKLNLYRLISLLVVATRPNTRFDAGASISAGAPVFVVPGEQIHTDRGEADGETLGGTILVSSASVADRHVSTRNPVFAHERVHVLQEDFMFFAWSEPTEGWLLDRVGWARPLRRHVDIGLTAPLLRLGLDQLGTPGWADRPLETEAEHLTPDDGDAFTAGGPLGDARLGAARTGIRR